MKRAAIHPAEKAMQAVFRDALAALRPPRKSRILTTSKIARR
jgi:hypothetical protein